MKKVLLELFDENEIQNVITANEIHPDQIVIFCLSGQEEKIQRRVLEGLLPVKPEYVRVKRNTFVQTVLSYCSEDTEVSMDIHGGNDLFIALAGSLASKMHLPLYYPDPESDSLLKIENNQIVQRPLVHLKEITIGDLIALYGGRIFDDDTPQLSFEEISWIQTIRKCDAYSHEMWDALCKVLSLKDRVRERESWLTLKEYRQVKPMADTLRDGGLISMREKGKIVMVTFASAGVRELFAIEGEWLEFDTCRLLKDRSEFSDVRCRVRVDWNGGSYDQRRDASSELDVLAMHRGRLACISCKTNGRSYDQDFFYQVYANARKLGGQTALPVLVHTGGGIQAVIRDKAKELGILIVEGSDVYNGKTAERILSAFHEAEQRED
jgi:hypothetical protein